MALNCFVAMAIGRPDTDRFFERDLKKALRAAIPGVEIHAVRVDKVEHNNNIDPQIMKLLANADLVVADLTYARPSVYFEAGFAERLVPVIYTCRKDHLGVAADDAHDPLRVHFDLQMRNIVPWNKPDDPAFRDRLQKRVQHVARPLLKKQAVAAVRQRERKEFAQHSARDQVKLLRQAVRNNYLSRVKFTEQSRFEWEEPVAWYRQGSTLRAFVVRGASHATARELVTLHEAVLNDLEHGLLDKVILAGTDTVEASLVVYSPGRLSEALIRKALTYARPTATGALSWSRETRWRPHIREAIGSVMSASDLLDRIRASPQRQSFFRAASRGVTAATTER